MLLKYFYDRSVAHASYMVGCQKTKEAVIVDPGRDVEQYVDMAKREGVKIVGVAETHIHADYVSGARELADRIGAKLYVSDEGTADWKYMYAKQYDHQLLTDGDTFKIGNIRFEVMHTPGHTPESISFVLTDQGGGADKPMGIFTGDFVFVGSIGRPDLLEEAAGIQNTAEPGARDLFKSAERFKQLPDYLQVWPAHGAGSACGKGLGAIPSSTVGYEKLFNPALQYTDENEFVKYILSEQPPAPKYFALMKKVNKEGPVVLGSERIPQIVEANELNAAREVGTIVDVRVPAAFADAHVAGTINLPMKMLASWGGWVIDYSKPVYLIAEGDTLREATRVLRKIGVEEISGAFQFPELKAAKLVTESYDNVLPTDVAAKIENNEVTLVDVRRPDEWEAGHIPQAEHRFLGTLPQVIAEIDDSKLIVAQCQSGARSSVATSILQAAGKKVVNLAGGYLGWTKAGLPVTTESVEACDVAGSCS